MVRQVARGAPGLDDCIGARGPHPPAPSPQRGEGELAMMVIRRDGDGCVGDKGRDDAPSSPTADERADETSERAGFQPALEPTIEASHGQT